MATISGYVSNFIFESPDSDFKIAVITESNGDETVITGALAGVSVGMGLEVEGDEVEHPTYGPQLRVRKFTEKEPENVVEILRYLASGAIIGIGEKMASRIVTCFGMDTLRIMEEEPERLAEVKGISLKKAQDIGVQVAEKRGQRKAMMFLTKFGITLNLAAKVYDFYGERIYKILKENPYKLAEDIDGVGFKTADEIAENAGISPTSVYRIQSGIIFALKEASIDGNTCLPLELLYRKSAELLGLSLDIVEKNFTDLVTEKKLILIKTDEGEFAYIRAFYNMESNVAFRLQELSGRVAKADDNLSKMIDRIEKETAIELDEKQRQAVIEAATRGLLIITGGPGTGKTTTLKTIIHYFDIVGMDFVLAAPTGRAAKRMSETTGYEAKTVHRLLEVGGGTEDAGVFGRDEDNPIEADAIIIDEMSMVDLPLMNALLKAVVKGTRLILVGDDNQLPSVGPGRVLGDIIDSEEFHVVKLEKIFRQAGQSDIVKNAHRINKGESFIPDNNSKDFFFLQREDVDKIINQTLTLVLEKMPKYVKAKPTDIQVLTPQKSGRLGVENLNNVLQAYLNPEDEKKSEYTRGNVVFRVGDKVMQVKNNYNLEWNVLTRYGTSAASGTGVFNGDVGIIRQIDTFTKELTVIYDENKTVVYPFSSLDEIELAYAITIHKSQGSEYPAVIMPLFGVARPLMTRNLLYTGVTRAKQCVTILGDAGTFNTMILNDDRNRRFTGLKDRIKENKKEA